MANYKGYAREHVIEIVVINYKDLFYGIMLSHIYRDCKSGKLSKLTKGMHLTM
jgi:hypothetical protein